jgi:hypothetical protein
LRRDLPNYALAHCAFLFRRFNRVWIIYGDCMNDIDLNDETVPLRCRQAWADYLAHSRKQTKRYSTGRIVSALLLVWAVAMAWVLL